MAYTAAKGMGTVTSAIRTSPAAASRAVAVHGVAAGSMSFHQQRDSLLHGVWSVFAYVIPQLGGSYGYDGNVHLYEVDQGNIIFCGGAAAVWEPNMAYCPQDDYVIWETGLSQAVYNNIGDGAWAGAIAHEFGHGAQRWLGWDNRGALYHKIYREALADCFAGAWLYFEYANGYLDFLGWNGWFDGAEFVYLLRLFAQGTAANYLDSHGTPDWRESWVNYGWNYGFLGCGQQANLFWHGIV